MLVIGIDIGTQSAKAVVMDEDLQSLGEASVAYAPNFPAPMWAEQDSKLWLDALRPAIAGALRAAGKSAKDVRSMGIAGQLDGCVPTGPSGEALGPCIIWMDRRATREIADIPAAAVLRKGGVILDPSHMAAKIRWLQRNSADARSIRRYHQPVSYVVSRLTGRHVFDPAVASTTMLYNLWDSAFDPELCALFSIDPGELPEIDRAEAVAGVLGARGAELTGLEPGITVAVGTGDDFSNPLGAGVVAPGRVVACLGTAEVVGAVHDRPTIDAGRLVETHGYAGGRFFIENPGWLSGGALAWFIRTLRLHDVAELNRLAAEAPPGAGGLTVLPTLAGATAPEWISEARGAVYGLTPAHDLRHLSRALLEGCAFAMRDVVERLVELGVDCERILLLGGGAKSPLWAQIRADVLQRPVDVASAADSSPLGAALLAAVAAGVHADLQTAAERIRRPAQTIEPRAAARAAYDDAYGRYRRLFDALRPMYRASGTAGG